MMTSTPRVLAGEPAFQRLKQDQPFYNISPDVYSGIVGSQEQERQTGIRSLSQFYEEQDRARRVLPI